jgi:hypothetical protein
VIGNGGGDSIGGVAVVNAVHFVVVPEQVTMILKMEKKM